MPRLSLLAALVFAAAISALAQAHASPPALHQQPDKDGVYFPGPEVTAPAIAHAPPVESVDYPRGFRGSFSVWSLVVQPDGSPTAVNPVQSLGGDFDAESARVIYQMTFVPGELNGEPVPVHIGVAIPFFPGVHPAPRIDVLEQDLDPAKANAAREADAPPILIHIAQALYSTDDIRARYEGSTQLSAVIGPDGLPEKVRVVKSMGMGMDEFAIEAVQRYRYLPALKDGKPVAASVFITVNFKLYGSQVPEERIQ